MRDMLPPRLVIEQNILPSLSPNSFLQIVLLRRYLKPMSLKLMCVLRPTFHVVKKEPSAGFNDDLTRM